MTKRADDVVDLSLVTVRRTLADADDGLSLSEIWRGWMRGAERR